MTVQVLNGQAPATPRITSAPVTPITRFQQVFARIYTAMYVYDLSTLHVCEHMTIQAFSGSIPGTPQSAVSETWSTPRHLHRSESPLIDLELTPFEQCQMAGSHCHEPTSSVPTIMGGTELGADELGSRAPGSPSILVDVAPPGSNRRPKRHRTSSAAETDAVVHLGSAPINLLAITDGQAMAAVADEDEEEMQRLLGAALDLDD